MKIFIVIPAYNEEKTIERVIDNLLLEGYRNIIVVDDGSRDQTYNIAKSKGVTVLKHIINRGQGAALQTGTTYSLIQGAEIIVHFDADGQHKAEEIENLIIPIRRGITEVSLGSRFLKKNKTPILRKIILKGAILIIWTFYGLKLTDAHNGFRALIRNAAKKIRITSDGMEHASQIIEQIKDKKIRYKEVPVTIEYQPDIEGQKNSNSVKILSKMIIRKIGL